MQKSAFTFQHHQPFEFQHNYNIVSNVRDKTRRVINTSYCLKQPGDTLSVFMLDINVKVRPNELAYALQFSEVADKSLYHYLSAHKL